MLYLPAFLASQEAISAPAPAPSQPQVGSGGCPRKPRVRVSNVYLFRRIQKERALDRHDRRSAGLVGQVLQLRSYFVIMLFSVLSCLLVE